MISIFMKRAKSIGLAKTIFLSTNRLLLALRWYKNISIRRCLCCLKLTLFAQLGTTIEGVRCLRCGANKRYELLAQALMLEPKLKISKCFVVEMDPNSPLSQFLESTGCCYLKTFYSDSEVKGKMVDGAQMEDICSMTLSDATVDVLISSDVLEHVPDLHGAIKETNRVLKLGGKHFFTVPLSEVMAPRAILTNGVLTHIKPPIYHLDPLNPNGCLVFWDFSEDIVHVFNRYGFTTCVIAEDHRTGYKAWVATKIQSITDKYDA